MTGIFYTLKELEIRKLTNLKHRMIKYRFNKLMERGDIVLGDLVYEEKNKYYVHYSLIDKFQPIRKRSNYQMPDYTIEMTINLGNDYDLEAYKFLGEQIESKLYPADTIYSIEEGSEKMYKNSFHIHFATNASFQNICMALKEVGNNIEIDILKNLNTHIADINNNGMYLNYLRKADKFGYSFRDYPNRKQNLIKL